MTTARDILGGLEEEQTVTEIEPLGDRVLVRPAEAEGEKRIGMIWVPDTANDPPAMGEVIAVGPGAWRDGVWHVIKVDVGDIVLYGKYAGSDVNIGTEKLLMLREGDLLGRVHERIVGES